MECNKEEALRAKVIAEKKLQDGDFIGAQRIAQRAQQLFPALENISQLITVCDVHCSAQNKLYGAGMDWYGILQVERVADDATIKKQYRKLALLLHPDKNKFFGAEPAFKLIGEANRVLSDQGKRSEYDLKYRVLLKPTAPKPPPYHLNRNSFVRKQYDVKNNFPNASTTTHGVGVNPHQQTQPGLSDGQKTFWTCCSVCGVRYQCFRDDMNRLFHCKTCKKSFIAYDLGAQSVPQGATWSQPAFPLHNQVPNCCPIKLKTQSTGMHPVSMGAQGSFSSKTAGPDLVKKKTCADEEAVGRSKSDKKEDGNVDIGSKKGVKMPKSDAVKIKMSVNSRRNRSKKRKILPEESSESYQTSSNEYAEEAVFAQEKGAVPSGGNSEFNGGHQPRRSSRKKQHISYKESVSDDDDFVSPPKRSRLDGPVGTGEKRNGKPLDDGVPKTSKPASFVSFVDGGKENIKQKENVPFKESVAKRKIDAGGCMANGKAAMAYHSDERCKGGNSEPNSLPDVTEEPVIVECPDPDFSDFEKDKSKDCFAVDQIWATYDPVDSMPRFYARIRKVCAPEFKLRFTWLEPCPDDAREIYWVANKLPYACGKFKNGQIEETSDLPMFSHQVHGGKGSIKNSYLIYPRKGETWAIYKNWNANWSANPEIQRKDEFEYVEILSDFVPDVGVGVAYLGKVKGFVSLFQRSVQHEILFFQMPPSEMLRFSHRVPSFRMTGTEGEGVPKGSFELDPAALPNNLYDVNDNGDLKMENDIVTGLNAKSPEKETKMMNSPTMIKPMKHEENDIERETSKLRRSPRELNGVYEKDGQANQSECAKSHGDFTQSEGDSYVNPAGERMNPKKPENDDLETGNFQPRRSPRSLNKKHRQVNATLFIVEEQVESVKDDNHGRFSHHKGSISSFEDDEKRPLHVKDRSSNSFRQNPFVSASISSNKFLEAQFHDFCREKSEDKFQTGQLWALYSEVDRMPKNYAQIKKIEPYPSFRLHVIFLESVSPPKDAVQPGCCGTFMVRNGKTKVFPCAEFSHLIKAELVGKNKFVILPAKGQIWALYKDWENKSMCSDIVNCKYDIVEVLEHNDHSTKVLVLLPVNGFKSIYMAQGRQRSITGVKDIPREELPRFSHQIPAFRHTGDEDACVADCWELDPASVPGILVCLD